MQKPIIAIAKYAVSDLDSPVLLSVTVGNGQIGASLAKLQDTVVGPGPEISNCRIGTNKELHGKTLVIRTTATDVSPHTNDLIVTYALTGGSSTFEQSLVATAEGEYDSGSFKMTIDFVKAS